MSRGPAYPYINLEAAVELTRKLYEFTKRTPANLGAVVRDKWEYSPTSSSAQKTVAALKYFGLVDLAESSDKTDTIKITDRAYRILVDSPTSPERKQAIRDACLSPKAYKLCWDLFGAEMPESMRSTLIFDHGFNESTVDGFLGNYKRSVHFAGLLEDLDEKKQESDLPLGVADDKMNQLNTHTARVSPASTGHTSATGHTERWPVPGRSIGMRQEVFSLAEGDVTIQWPESLSQESFQDFEDWLVILRRKIKRSVVSPASQQATSQRSESEDEDY